MPLKAYWWPAKNFGDTLTPIIVEHFLDEKVEFAKRNDEGKLVGVGSIMVAMRRNDVIWGTGTNRDWPLKAPAGACFLAVRGPLTRDRVKRAVIPEIYGDPAILLPLIYKPEIKKTHTFGLIPHYVDKPAAQKMLKDLGEEKNVKMIDIQADWKKVIEETLACDCIVATSLHGLIVAEAYGIPAVWLKLGDKIRGAHLKFNDYLLGTGRKPEKACLDYRNIHNIPPIQNLADRQEKLINALKTWRKSM